MTIPTTAELRALLERVERGRVQVELKHPPQNWPPGLEYEYRTVIDGAIVIGSYSVEEDAALDAALRNAAPYLLAIADAAINAQVADEQFSACMDGFEERQRVADAEMAARDALADICADAYEAREAAVRAYREAQG